MAGEDYNAKIHGNQGGDILTVESGGTLNIASGGAFQIAGVAVTATAAELNAVAGNGLSAAELAVLDGVVAGTSTASKAAVLGANKNLDILALPVSGLKIGAGAGTAVTTTAAQLNQVTDAHGTVAFDRAMKVARVALAAVDTGGGVFAWANPEVGSILVERVILDITTQTSGACTLDVGTTAASATTLSDNLIDGVDPASAPSTPDNLGDAGANGKARQKLATSKWVTGSVASGNSAGIVGFAYIHYINI